MTDAATGAASATGATGGRTTGGDAAAAAAAAATAGGATGAAAGTAPGTTGGAGGDGKGGDAAAAAAAAAATGAGDKSGTATGGDGKGAATAANPWSADTWRGTWAGADKQKEAWAARRADLGAALESAYNADKKIEELAARAKAAPLAADATPEQIAQYRKDNGVPDSLDGYLKDLPTKLSDEDKALMTPYLQTMHDLNLRPDQVQKLLGVRQAQFDKLIETQGQQDQTLKTQVEDQLRGEWGNDFRPNINAIHNLLAGFAPGAREAIMEARGPDGKALFNNKEVMQAFAQIARTVSPFGTITGGDGGTLDAKGVDARMTEIEAMMGAPKGSPAHKQYWSSQTVQKEYHDLIEAKQRLKVRTAA